MFNTLMPACAIGGSQTAENVNVFWAVLHFHLAFLLYEDSLYLKGDK